MPVLTVTRHFLFGKGSLETLHKILVEYETWDRLVEWPSLEIEHKAGTLLFEHGRCIDMLDNWTAGDCTA